MGEGHQLQEAWGGAQRGGWYLLGTCYRQYQDAWCVSGLRKVRKSATHDPPRAQLSAVTQLRPISNTHSSDLSSNPAEGEETEGAIWNLLQFSESQSTYPAWRVCH